jgi:glycosyltransferase involved in cell wall biosynthesis
MNPPRISVVVPTFRRPELLRRCLLALCSQDLDPGDFEIVVADDGPSPGTARVVNAVRERPGSAGIRYVPVRLTQGPACARNLGWRAAQAPFIAFTDDDTIPRPGWLRAGLAALEAGADAAVGRTIVPVPDVPTDYERGVSGLERAEFITANCFVRRLALERTGGFDERYEKAWREDSDLQFALLDRGFWTVSAPEAVVVHPVRPAPWGVSLSQQRQVMYDALLYRKYPRHYRQRIRAVPPIGYYMSVLALVVGTVALFTGRPWVAAGGLSTWVFLTLALCRRRLRGASRSPRHVLEMLATSALIPSLALFWRVVGSIRYRVFFA